MADVVNELKSYGVLVEIIDPYASSEELEKEYGFALCKKPGNDYAAIIVAVAHKEYTNLPEDYFRVTLADQKELLWM